MRRLRKHWGGATIVVCMIVVVGGAGYAGHRDVFTFQVADRLDRLEERAGHLSEALSQLDNSVGCPLVDEVDGLEVSINDLAAEHQADIRALQEQLQALSHSVGVGDIDVACLYRGYVFRRHNGHVRQAVKDRPVPGGWTPLSPLVYPPSNAECAKRFGP